MLALVILQYSILFVWSLTLTRSATCVCFAKVYFDPIPSPLSLIFFNIKLTVWSFWDFLHAISDDTTGLFWETFGNIFPFVFGQNLSYRYRSSTITVLTVQLSIGRTSFWRHYVAMFVCDIVRTAGDSKWRHSRCLRWNAGHVGEGLNLVPS